MIDLFKLRIYIHANHLVIMVEIHASVSIFPDSKALVVYFVSFMSIKKCVTAIAQ